MIKSLGHVIIRQYIKIGHITHSVIPLGGNEFRLCECGGLRIEHENLPLERGGLARAGCEFFRATQAALEKADRATPANVGDFTAADEDPHDDPYQSLARQEVRYAE